MIGQNRLAAFAQAKADHDFTEQELGLKTNTELTREVAALMQHVQARLDHLGSRAIVGQQAPHPD